MKEGRPFGRPFCFQAASFIIVLRACVILRG
jgi:hypothetical protein